jgi:6-phosphogluconate dehydrogenase (decarboxylating)
MLGCKFGVLEDRVATELSPNVALEYGFMKAMNKRVGLFRNADFRHHRADFSGKLAKTFEIDSADALNVGSLKTAIEAWLLDVGVSPREHA